MSRICGQIASGAAGLDLAGILLNCYSVKKPGAAPAVKTAGPEAGLAAEEPNQLAASSDGRYLCAVDGQVHPSPRLAEAIRAMGLEPDRLSPAETVLAVFLDQGADGCRLLEGGFVFAILDAREKALVLGRDMFGVKTLFYASTPSGFLFASSLAAVAASPWFQRTIGAPGFLEYMACGYISTPWTMYEHAWALKPGECVTVKGGEVTRRHFHTLEPQGWQFLDTRGQSEAQMTDRFEALLAAAVSRRLPARGEVAAYLSGGMDTSLLCAILKDLAGKRVVAYTLGFNGRPHDETPYARAVAEHLGIQHQAFHLQKDEALALLPMLPRIYGQPLADVSAVPTCVIASKVGQRFEAIFDGQGPDFLFGNFDLRILYQCHRALPKPVRLGLARASQFLTRHFFKSRTSPNLDVAELLRQPEFFWIFTRMFKSRDLEQLIGEPVYPESFWGNRFLESRTDIPLAERLRLVQFLCYGINDVLFKASGAHSASLVHLLCPFFDLEVFNFIQFLPTDLKFRGFYGKHLQKQLLYRKVPKPLLDRPKRGFVMDFVEFGVDTTRALTDRYLTRKRLGETGLFNADFALQCVEGYYHGDPNMGPKLWTLLMFEMWREAFSITGVAQ